MQVKAPRAALGACLKAMSPARPSLTVRGAAGDDAYMVRAPLWWHLSEGARGTIAAGCCAQCDALPVPTHNRQEMPARLAALSVRPTCIAPSKTQPARWTGRWSSPQRTPTRCAPLPQILRRTCSPQHHLQAIICRAIYLDADYVHIRCLQVLDKVRPYLVADGGNCAVAGISNGVVMVELQGACGSCPSSTATMKMGIEQALRAAFGDKVTQVLQVGRAEEPVTVDTVNEHLEMLRPAITAYGGSVNVLSVKGEVCFVQFSGPPPIAQGVQAAIKDKFPTIATVEFQE